jgi:hypothetical protein
MNAMSIALLLIQQKVIEVRPDGTVWKLKNLNTMPLSAPRRLETTTKAGYLAVRVNADRKAFMLQAHRLVWTALNGPIPEGMTINHIDGKKTNNHPSNLEAVSQADNNRHAYKVLKRLPPPHIPAPIVPSISARAKDLRAQGLSFSKIAAALQVSQTTAFKAVKSA